MKEIYNRFDTRYAMLCRQPIRHFCYKLEILDWYEFPTEELTDLLIDEGSITINRSQGVRRSCSIVLANVNKESEPTQNSKFWYTRKFKLWSGMVDEADNTIYWFSQGVFLTTAVSSTADGRLEITGVDKFGLFTAEYGASVLEAEHRIKAGTKITTAIRDIIQMDMGNQCVCDPVEPLFDVSLYGEEVPYDISTSAGQYIGDILVELALCLGSDIYYDTDGRLNVHSGTTDTHYRQRGSQWVFEQNDINIVSFGSSAELGSAVNVVTVTGTDENDCHYYYTAENRDPTSPINVNAVGKRAGETIETSMGYSEQRCKEYAEYWLKEKSLIALSLSFECVFLPHLDVDKNITITGESTMEQKRYIITALTIPFGSIGSMSMSATNIVDLLHYNEI